MTILVEQLIAYKKLITFLNIQARFSLEERGKSVIALVIIFRVTSAEIASQEKSTHKGVIEVVPLLHNLQVNQCFRVQKRGRSTWILIKFISRQ